MRIPIALGVAMGCVTLIAAEHALSRGDNPPRFTDPDLIALEKVGARAKRAMDAFVLRPRLPDSYDFVCSGCLGEARAASAFRAARPAIGTPRETDPTAAAQAPRLRKPRYASLPPAGEAGRAAAPRQRIGLQKRRGRWSDGSSAWSDAAASWESELRR